MKTEFKAKFLQNISKKRSEEGFTLIELLVVIIIIGILSAIALPSFLNQANKAKQSEAKQYLSSINKGQQAYYVENAAFGSSVEILGVGIKTQTNNYKYGIQTPNGTSGVTSYADQAPGITNLKTYTGAVGVVNAGGADKSTVTILCESSAANVVSSATAVSPTTNGTSDPSCAGGFTLLK